MTVSTYAEYTLLRKRLAILDGKGPEPDDHPDIELSLKEVRDIDAVISTLQSIRKVYGGQRKVKLSYDCLARYSRASLSISSQSGTPWPIKLPNQ
jgi:hypothetical protein